MTWLEIFTAFFGALGTFIITVGLPVWLKYRAQKLKEEEAREKREEARAARARALTKAMDENTKATDAARRATTDHAQILSKGIPTQKPPGTH